jgi:hypothetical protein
LSGTGHYTAQLAQLRLRRIGTIAAAPQTSFRQLAFAGLKSGDFSLWFARAFRFWPSLLSLDIRYILVFRADMAVSRRHDTPFLFFASAGATPGAISRCTIQFLISDKDSSELNRIIS